jgi:hypothetical protein
MLGTLKLRKLHYPPHLNPHYPLKVRMQQMELVKMKGSTHLLATARSFIAVSLMRREVIPNTTLHVEKEQSGIRTTMFVTMTGLCREVTVALEVQEVRNKQEAVRNQACQDKLNKGVNR